MTGGPLVDPRTLVNDDLIRRLLAEGRLQTDPTAGLVWLDGDLVTDRIAGYVKVMVDGHIIGAHRVVWIAAHGHIPAGYQLNHRNRARADNRLSNLEAVTPSQNRAHASDSYWTQPFIRAEDLIEVQEVRPDWLVRVAALAADPTTTAEQVAELRAEIRGEPPKVMPFRSRTVLRAAGV